MADAYGSLPFREQIEYFRRKVNLPTAGWTDVYTQEHDYAFVVAGANRDAIVADFRVAVEKAIADGRTLEDFRKDFDRIVARNGWDYKGGRNWRSKVIYDTNLATSYAAGRWQQLQAAPFWQYQHSDWVEHPRAQHVAWDGLVLSREDSWWQAHFPPNGWGCQCTVRGLWPRDMERLGKDGPDATPTVKMVEQTIGQRSLNGPRTVKVPQGIDPGFEYAPGSARLRNAIPPERPTPPIPGKTNATGSNGLPNQRPQVPLPPPHMVPPEQYLSPSVTPDDAVDAFLRPLGATSRRPAIVRDAIGERLVVGKELFQTPQGTWRDSLRSLRPFLPMLAQAILQPDEIWVRLEWIAALKKAVVRRRYLARFAVAGARMEPVTVVFEVGEDGWASVAGLQSSVPDVNDWRVGTRLYSRDQG